MAGTRTRTGAGRTAAAPGIRRAASQAGFSLVECVVAGAVVAIGAVGALSVILSAFSLDRTNRETRAAFAIARARLDALRAEPFANVLRTVNDDPADDPDGPGTGVGRRFDVRGLLTANGRTVSSVADVSGAAAPDSGAAVGEVLLPLDGSGLVREDLDVPELGLPRDLNGDGTIDAGDHSADAVILPIAVRIRWRGAQGPREFTAGTVLHR